MFSTDKVKELKDWADRSLIDDFRIMDKKECEKKIGHCWEWYAGKERCKHCGEVRHFE